MRIIRWMLAALGAYLVFGLALQGNALGLGVAVACVLAVIKGVFMAVRPPVRPSPPQSD